MRLQVGEFAVNLNRDRLVGSLDWIDEVNGTELLNNERWRLICRSSGNALEIEAMIL